VRQHREMPNMQGDSYLSELWGKRLGCFKLTVGIEMFNLPLQGMAITHPPRLAIICFERLKLKTIQSARQVNPELDITNCLIFKTLYGIFIAEVIRK
jgi:hypothetical protein